MISSSVFQHGLTIIRTDLIHQWRFRDGESERGTQEAQGTWPPLRTSRKVLRSCSKVTQTSRCVFTQFTCSVCFFFHVIRLWFFFHIIQIFTYIRLSRDFLTIHILSNTSTWYSRDASCVYLNSHARTWWNAPSCVFPHMTVYYSLTHTWGKTYNHAKCMGIFPKGGEMGIEMYLSCLMAAGGTELLYSASKR